MTEPVPITRSLDAVMRSLRGPDRAAVSGVFGRWREIVGDDVALHVRPLKLDGARLVVGVVDPAWATQVGFLAPTILERVREVAGVGVDDLDVRVVESFRASRTR